MAESVVQTLLELSEPWCCGCFLGEHVPGTNRSRSEEPFPKVQSELPLTWLHTFSTCNRKNVQFHSSSSMKIKIYSEYIQENWSSCRIKKKARCPLAAYALEDFWSPNLRLHILTLKRYLFLHVFVLSKPAQDYGKKNTLKTRYWTSNFLPNIDDE